MPTEEPKKPPMPGGLNHNEPTLGALQESGGVTGQKPERDLVPTSTALQVYIPQMPAVQTQGSVAVVRSRQELLHEAQQTLLKLMVDYTAIVLYLL